MDDVKVDDLIIEYVGEVIPENEMLTRLETHEKLHPNNPNFYIMELMNGWYIDARERGNMSRFINHSCDPNCQLQRVNVAGNMRWVRPQCSFNSEALFYRKRSSKFRYYSRRLRRLATFPSPSPPSPHAHQHHPTSTL